MNIVAKLFAVLLCLLALVTGGCALAFAPMVWKDLSGDAGIAMIWFGGIAIGALCIWGAVKLFRYEPAKPPELPKSDDAPK